MQPVRLDAATLRKLVSAAVAAPSIHNTQPWRFRWDPEHEALLVHAAAERGLPYEDPQGRALHVSVGAALFNLRVAAASVGLYPDIRLFPDPAEHDLLAALRFSGQASGAAAPGSLYGAVWSRHSSRHPFSARRPRKRLLTVLTEAAHTEGARLYFPDHDETERLRHLTAEAEWYNHSDPLRRAESRQWIHDEGEDGLRRAALGPHDAAGRLPVRDYSSLRPTYQQPSEAFESEPCIGVLTTVHDKRTDWLRAGQALERVLLQATSDGLATSLLHQALEWPELRWLLRDPTKGMYYVQMIIRFGYGPEGSASPRRAVGEVLERQPKDERQRFRPSGSEAI